MKSLYSILLLIPFFSIAQLQDKKSNLLLEGGFSSFSADNLGNIYVITPESQLKKFNSKGDSMGVFNDVRRYGTITSFNTSNPLRTVIYFGNYKTILVLDRFLNVVNTLDLKRNNLFQIETICPAYDNNIWIFDEQENKLKKISEEGKIISETADLRIGLDEAIIPTWMTDQNSLVYLYDQNKGLFIFDYFGVLKSKVSILNWTNLQVIGNAVFGRKDDKLMKYIPGSLQIQEIEIPESIKKASKINIQTNGIYIMDHSGITLFGF